MEILITLKLVRSSRHKQDSPESLGDYRYLTLYTEPLITNFHHMPYFCKAFYFRRRKEIHLVTEAISLMIGNTLLRESLEQLAKPPESCDF